MKVIDLKKRAIYVDDIEQIYCETNYSPERYNIQTIYGTYSVDYEDYLKVKDYLLSLNDEVEVIEEKEETKPITKESIEALGYAWGQMQKCFTSGWNKSLKNEPLIEEDKKIEKLDHKDFTNRFGAEEITDMKLVNKINEIIDKINEGE